jgi:hypothetical protein
MGVAKKYSRVVVTTLACVIALGTLSGCGEAATNENVPAGEYPDLSLADSKAPAQLLRNTAVTRIPEAVVLNVGTDTDGSIACLSEEDDPEGAIRRWDSSADVNLKLSEATNAPTIVADLIKTFTDEGWMSQAIRGSKADNQAFLLTNGTSSAASVSTSQVRIEAVITGDKVSAYVHIDSLGPCVVTDGADSDEVTDLGKL